MIENIPDAPPGVIAVRVRGWVLREDFDAVRPRVDEALQSGEPLRAVICLDDTFAGITPGALVEDLRLGLRAFRHWRGCAIVTPRWLRTTARLVDLFVPWPVRAFDEAELEQAYQWLGASAPGAASGPGTATEAATGERS